MNTRVHTPGHPPAPVHAVSTAHPVGHEQPGYSSTGGFAGTAVPGQFRGTLFKLAQSAARPSLQARGRRSVGGARRKAASGTLNGDDGGFPDHDESSELDAASTAALGAGGQDRDDSAADEERRLCNRFAAMDVKVRAGAVKAATVGAIPEWAHAAVGQGGAHELLLRLTQRLMRTIDGVQTASGGGATPALQQILRDLAGALRAAGGESLDIGGWPGVCSLLREASRTRTSRPTVPNERVRALNLMLPVLLHVVTRACTPAQRARLIDRMELIGSFAAVLERGTP